MNCGLLYLVLSGDGDEEFVLALFGPLDRDEKGDSIMVCSACYPSGLVRRW